MMKRAVSILLAVVLLTAIFSIPASARASHQIAGFSITITPMGSGNVRVVTSVSGTHNQMTTIGMPAITIYERNNSSSAWRIVHSTGPHYNPNTTAGSHSHAVTFQGVAGRQYYAHAGFFAQDSQGSDSRSASSPIITAS
jgi:hypothetical protein